ncbi:MAG: DUF559 domain-containing protein [Pseudomonadota bacterium]
MTRNRTTRAKARSRSMRKALTTGEAKLWSELKQFRRIYGIHVRRQVPIGPYFADFAILSHGLIIELDGEHHFTASGQQHDANRDATMLANGYRTFRINTGEWSENPDGCIETLLVELGVR